MPGAINLLNHPWLVRSWILEENTVLSFFLNQYNFKYLSLYAQISQALIPHQSSLSVAENEDHY